MKDALGNYQRVVVLGGASAIAVATVSRWARARPGLEVVLAARPSARRDAAVAELSGLGARVHPVDLDVEAEPAAQQQVMASVYGDGRDVDVVLVAFGVLGDQEEAWRDPVAAVRIVDVNMRAAVLHGVLAGNRLRSQGHGALVLLSSVAGERVRRSNFPYGATKAGADGFYRGLTWAMAGTGVQVLVVRPGFVHSPMTRGLRAAPLSVEPADVALAIDTGLRAGRDVVWVPGAMRWVMRVLRAVPEPIFRRLPL